MIHIVTSHSGLHKAVSNAVVTLKFAPYTLQSHVEILQSAAYHFAIRHSFTPLIRQGGIHCGATLCGLQMSFSPIYIFGTDIITNYLALGFRVLVCLSHHLRPVVHHFAMLSVFQRLSQLFISSKHVHDTDIKAVAVIGAGAAGVASAKLVDLYSQWIEWLCVMSRSHTCG